LRSLKQPDGIARKGSEPPQLNFADPFMRKYLGGRRPLMDIESEYPLVVVRKWRHACDVFREADPFNLEPGEDGAPDFGYDFDPFCIIDECFAK
jgi:hypothetical protein